jgi:hypothetical protein
MSDREIMNAKRPNCEVIGEWRGFRFRDPVVKRVCEKFVDRSDVGFEKYGRTLHDERIGKLKDLSDYLNDVQEELMDAILYIQAAREEIADIVPDTKDDDKEEYQD